MTFVSYAQNFEDVLLRRALGHLKTGFYIDVGASHPDIGSVTRAFYDRGWSGINIAPTEPGCTRLCAARPRDLTLGLAAAETLAALCARHAPADVHFLRIGAAGAEHDLLAGAEFVACRPWLILVEAGAPSPASDWEGMLTAADYRFLWFDGLSRWYAAAERFDALVPSFRTPPNVFDDFLRAADTEWARRIDQAETRAAMLLGRVTAAELRAEVAEGRAETANLRLVKIGADAAQAGAQAARIQAEHERLTQMAPALAARAEQAERDLAAIRASTSWRVTQPMRSLVGLRGRPAPGTALPMVAAVAEQPAVPEPTPPRVGGRLRAVHQFHSGSAVGDAVTNSMLIVRGLLRRLGYDSRIFVQHRDPACGDDLHGIDEMPSHDRYVLIVHHSMGHDTLARILALPVRKILMYHNITPAGMLSDTPFMQAYAQKGRDQLNELRGTVAATLAASEYNALELRHAGFSDPVACPLLFDLDVMRARVLPRRETDCFTILFVGRIARSKGQLELIDAYARFRAGYAGTSRLVLVGRHAPGDPYLQSMLAAIHRHGLDAGAVEITGLVTDDELWRRYAEANLYVSLSQHEGFGVPLIEAMVHGVPVLAWPSAAVPYTLDGASPLLTDLAPASVAARIDDLARDPATRAEIADRQRRSVDRFHLSRQVPKLVAALLQAGAAALPDRAMHDAFARNMRVTVAGHVNGAYSLAEVNRSLAAAIEAARPGAVRLVPVEGAVTADVSGIPAGQRAAMRPLLARPAFDTGPEVVISQHYPAWSPVRRGDLTLALFFWEESLVPAETVDRLGRDFDGVLAPTAAVAKALIDSGVRVPVRVLGQAPRLEPFCRLRDTRLAAHRAGRPPGPFTFLHVSSCFPRKGVDVLLAAYARAFRRGDPVRLVIKGFPNPHNDAASLLRTLQEADPGAPAVELIEHDMDEDQLLALFADADVMVLPTRGEGYNLPAAEALASGMPVIVTGHGGHMDFVAAAPPGAVRLLDFRFAPSASHLASPGSLWAEPDADDLVAAMREAFGRGPVVVAELTAPVSDIAARLADIAADLLVAPEPPALSVAWVTPWLPSGCEVAMQSRALLTAMPDPGVVLADKRSAATPAGGSPPVEPCWLVSDEASVPGLVCAILRHDPAAVVVQHRPGLMGWGMLAALLRSPALRGRVVCVALHDTAGLLDAPAAERLAAVAALAATSRVVVHSVDDLDRLHRLGLSDVVTMIPHGVAGPDNGASWAQTAARWDGMLNALLISGMQTIPLANPIPFP